MSEDAREYEGFQLEPHNGGWLVRSYNGSEDDLRIPAEVDGLPVVMIAAKAFEDNMNLRSVEIPDSVTFVGNYAFWHCGSLERARLSRGMKALNLGTFWSCTSLTQVEIPDTITELGDGVFQACTSLVSVDIPEGVTIVGDSCFRSCPALTQAMLPASVVTIMRNAYRDCPALSTVVIHGGVEYIGPRAFQGCPALESITVVDDDIDVTMNAMRNYSLMCFVPDLAVERGMLPFDEAKTLLNSKSDRERKLAALAMASYPDRLGEVATKLALTRTLAEAGRTQELHVFEGRPGYFSKPALLKCIDAANANDRTETAAYLLDLVARMEAPASTPGRRSTGLEL